MVNSIQVNISEVVGEGRFNPKYFSFLITKKKLVKKCKFSFITLENKDFFPVVSDGIHTAIELLPKSEIKYLYIHNLKEGFIDTVDSNYISESDNDKNKSKELKIGAVLLSVVGTLGNTAIFSEYFNFRCSLPRNIAYIYCNEKKILPEFLTSYFLSEFSKYQCAYSGGGNIQGLISLTKLKKFIVPELSITLQSIFAEKYKQAISFQKQFLDVISECKAFVNSKLELKRNVIKRDISFKANIQTLVENKSWTPVSFDPFGEKVLSYIGSRFPLEELHKHVHLHKGIEIGSDNYLDYLSKSKSSIPFLRTSDIFNYELDSYPDFYCDESFFTEIKQTIQPNDIAFTKDGSIGNLAMITKEDQCILSSGIAFLRLKETSSLSANYIFICLSIKEIGQFQADKRTVIASTIPHLRPQNLLKIKIPILDNESRKYINERVALAYSFIEEKKRIIKELKADMNILIYSGEFPSHYIDRTI